MKLKLIVILIYIIFYSNFLFAQENQQINFPNFKTAKGQKVYQLFNKPSNKLNQQENITFLSTPPQNDELKIYEKLSWSDSVDDLKSNYPKIKIYKNKRTNDNFSVYYLSNPNKSIKKIFFQFYFNKLFSISIWFQNHIEMQDLVKVLEKKFGNGNMRVFELGYQLKNKDVEIILFYATLENENSQRIACKFIDPITSKIIKEEEIKKSEIIHQNNQEAIKNDIE